MLITPLYYKYPYSLQSLQTEVKQSNLEMGGYFTLALWSNCHNTQACRAMLALPLRKSNILVTSKQSFFISYQLPTWKSWVHGPSWASKQATAKEQHWETTDVGSQRNPKPSTDRQDCWEQPEPVARHGHGTARGRCRQQSQAQDHVELMRISACTFISCSVLRHSKILSIRSSS